MKKLLYLFFALASYQGFAQSSLSLPYPFRNVNSTAGPETYYLYRNGAPWVNVATIKSTVTSSERYVGQTFIVAGTPVTEYWFAGGIADTDLVAKASGGGGGITTLTGDVTATGSGSVAASVVKILGNTIPSNASGVLTNNGSGTLSWASVGGTGTVTSASVVTANGVSGSVATATTTPAITLTLGAITPTSVNTVAITGSSTPTLAVTGTTAVSGTNTGNDKTAITGMIKGTGAAMQLATAVDYIAPLVPTTTKTASYTAVVKDLVVTDASSAIIPILLPTNPADKSLVGVRMNAVTAPNNTTVTTGGSDVFNKASGPTVITLYTLNEIVIFQYHSATAIWYVVGGSLAVPQLDLRYGIPSQAGNSGFSLFTDGNTNSWRPSRGILNITPYSTMSFYGDSWTAGLNLGPTASILSFPVIVAKQLNATANLQGIGGNGGYFTTKNFFTNQTYNAHNPMVLEVGLNDIRLGTGAATVEKMKSTTRAFIASHFLQIAYAADAATYTSRTGGWTTVGSVIGQKATSLGGNALVATAVGENIQFYCTGNTAVIGTFSTDEVTVFGGDFTILVDGLYSYGTYTGKSKADGLTVQSRVDGIVQNAVVITNMGAGNHTIQVTTTSTSATRIDYFGQLQSPELAAPILVLSLPKLDATGYSTNTVGGSNAIWDTTNAAVATIASDFPGYPIQFVDINNNGYYNPATDMDPSDHLHPLQAGHAHVASAVLSAVAPATSYSNFTSFTDVLTDYYRSGTASFFGAYSGKAYSSVNYNPASATILNANAGTASHEQISANGSGYHVWKVSSSNGVAPTGAMVLDATGLKPLSLATNVSTIVSDFFNRSSLGSPDIGPAYTSTGPVVVAPGYMTSTVFTLGTATLALSTNQIDVTFTMAQNAGTHYIYLGDDQSNYCKIFLDNLNIVEIGAGAGTTTGSGTHFNGDVMRITRFGNTVRAYRYGVLLATRVLNAACTGTNFKFYMPDEYSTFGSFSIVAPPNLSASGFNTSNSGTLLVGDPYSGAITPSTKVEIRGMGNASATNALLITNLAGTQLLKITDDATALLSGNLAVTGQAAFTPTSVYAGIRIGSYAGNPSSLSNGDLWYNSTLNQFNARINGATVALGAGGGGGGITALTGDVTASGSGSVAASVVKILGNTIPTDAVGVLKNNGSGTLTWGSTAAFPDTSPIAYNFGDNTKQVRFNLSGLTTATTRVLTVQDRDYTIAGTDDIAAAALAQVSTTVPGYAPTGSANSILAIGASTSAWISSLSSNVSITSGTASTIANNTGSSLADIVVLINPATVLSSYTLTTPATLLDGQEIVLLFGGTITAGNPVVTTLSIIANSGQAILQNITPASAVSGDAITYKYVASIATLFRKF